jgi:hypothetical protein
MANKDKLRREQQAWAQNQHTLGALFDAPPNSVKRILRRTPGEPVMEAVARAQTMPWWPWVIDPTPKGDVRFWVWYVDAAVAASQDG